MKKLCLLLAVLLLCCGIALSEEVDPGDVVVGWDDDGGEIVIPGLDDLPTINPIFSPLPVQTVFIDDTFHSPSPIIWEDWTPEPSQTPSPRPTGTPGPTPRPTAKGPAFLLPENLRRIESGSFLGVEVKELYIPQSVEYIAPDAFDSLRGATLFIPRNSYAQHWCDSNGLDYYIDAPLDKDFLYHVTEKGIVIDGGWGGEIDLPDASMGRIIYAINDEAFQNYGSNGGDELLDMDGLRLPRGLKQIGKRAFCNCQGLKGDLILPEGLESLEESAFEGCAGLTGNVTIPEGITAIEKRVFYGCEGLAGITMHEGVVSIGMEAFWKVHVGALTLPDSVQSIGDYAFYQATFDMDLIVPGSVKNISTGAFSNCVGKNIVLQPGIETVGDYAFAADSEGEERFTGTLSLPDSLQSVGVGAFQYQSGITGSLLFGENLKKLDYFAFRECTGLTGGLYLPDSLTTLGEWIFDGCTGLNGELRLPDGMVTVPACLVHECSGLTGVLTIPDTVEVIGDGAFSGCSGLTGSLALPAGLRHIGRTAFGRCGFTGQLAIPENVEVLDDYAFYKCEGFTSLIVWSHRLKEIGERAFSGCIGLERMELGEGIEEIGDAAFENCTALTGKVIIPFSVRGMQATVFYNNPNVSKVYVLNGRCEIYNLKYYKDPNLYERGYYSLNASSAVRMALGSQGEGGWKNEIFFDSFGDDDALCFLYRVDPNTSTSTCVAMGCEYRYGKSYFAHVAPDGEGAHYRIRQGERATYAFTIDAFVPAFEYVRLEDGTLRVTGLRAENCLTEIEVPDKIDGAEVKQIDDNTFASFDRLRLIVLPSALESSCDTLILPHPDTRIVVREDKNSLLNNEVTIDMVLMRDGSLKVGVLHTGVPEGVDCTYSLMTAQAEAGPYHLQVREATDCDYLDYGLGGAYRQLYMPQYDSNQQYMIVKKTLISGEGHRVELYSRPVRLLKPAMLRQPTLTAKGMSDHTIQLTISDSSTGPYLSKSYPLPPTLNGYAIGRIENGRMIITLPYRWGEKSSSSYMQDDTVVEDRLAAAGGGVEYHLMASYIDANGVQIIGKTIVSTVGYGLPKPQAVCELSVGQIRVSWNAVRDAEAYEVYMAVDGGEYTLMDTPLTTFWYGDIPEGAERCDFRVRSVRGSFISVFSECSLFPRQDTGVVRMLSIHEMDYMDDASDVFTADSETYMLHALENGTPEGLPFAGSYLLENQGKEEIRSAIREHLALQATARDVSILYFSSHGNSNVVRDEAAGALCLTSGETIYFSELSEWLSQIQGKVIIVLGSCGSGSAIGDTLGENLLEKILNFVDSWSAPLKKDNFYVICGAKGGVIAQASNNLILEHGFDLIAEFIYQATLYGDANGDGTVTMRELETYVADQAMEFNKDNQESDGKYTAVWPKNDDYPIFVLK